MIVVDASAFVEVVATPDSDRGAVLVDEMERDPHWVVLALAEELASPLVTADAKLSRVPGIRCRVLGPV